MDKTGWSIRHWKQNENWICEDCYQKLKINIIYEKEYNKFYDEKIYLFKYKDIRKLILKYKFNNKSYLYYTFTNIILKNKKLCRKLKFYDIIIPVPMYEKKKKQRGYNQTELITNEISQKLGIPTDLKVLKKIRNTQTQSTLKEKDRYKNIENAFGMINKKIIENKKVILFDDIITTGSTVNECSRVLKQNGAKEVLVLAIAKD